MSTPFETACPGSAALAALADGTLGEPSRTPVVAHVAGCEECLDTVEMLVRMDGGGVPVLPADLKAAALAIVPRPSVQRRWRPVLAAAATVILGVGGWYYVQQRALVVPGPHAIAEDRVRNAQSDSQLPHVVRPAAGQRVRGNALSIEWRQTSAALAYRVRVMRDDGQLLWERETPETTTVIPQGVSLPSGVPLYVTVTAVLPDGKTTRAPAVRFELE